MSVVKHSKVVGSLPTILEPDCLYYVRVGQGFDLYLTDHTGSVAHKQNVEDIVTSMFDRLDKTGAQDMSDRVLEIIKFCKDNRIPLKTEVQADLKITKSINLRETFAHLPNINFILHDNSAEIIIGGNSNVAYNPSQTFGRIMRNDFRMSDLNPRNRTIPTCKIIGAKGQNITIQQCDYLQLYCSTDVKDRSIAYCNFTFDMLIRLEITTNPNNPDSLELWCNENNFYLKRCYALDMTGSYRHNCNLFIGGGFENQYGYINLEAAAKNRFLHTRLEGIGQITFGEQSEGNVIERAYFGSTNSLGIIPVTDNGVLNRINTLTLENSVKTRIVELTENTPKWNNSVANPFTEVSEYLRTTKTWYPIFTSPTFKMKGREDYLVFDWDNTAARYMITVEFFDDVGNKINPSAINFNSPFLTYQANKQWLQGNHFGGAIYGTRNFTIMTPGEYNVKVSICSNSKLTEQLSKRFTVDMYSNRPVQVTKHEEVLSDIPTQFLGKSGDSATLLDGRRVVCIGSKADTIVGFNVGAKSITSTSPVANLVKSGAIIQIKNGDGTFIWKTVANTAGTNSLVLTDFTGVSSPVSYKAFNLEYSEPTSGAAYDDTLVKQQIDSIIAVNRQFEERLNLLSSNSNDIVTSFEEGVIISPRIIEDSFELYLENAENEEIVLSILSIDGVISNEEIVLSSSNSYRLKYKDITLDDIRTKLNLQWLQTPVVEFKIKAIRHNSNKVRQSYIRADGNFSYVSRNSPNDIEPQPITSPGSIFACYSVKVLNDLNVLISGANLHGVDSSEKIVRLDLHSSPSVSKNNIYINDSIFLITNLESSETELFHPEKEKDFNKYLGKSIKISTISDNLAVHEYEYDFSPVPIEEALKLRVFNDYILSPTYKDGHKVTFVTDLDNTQILLSTSDNGETINYYTRNYQIRNDYRYSSSDFERNKNNIAPTHYYGFENFILGKIYSDLKISKRELDELLSRNTNGIKIYVFGITDIDGVGDLKFYSYSGLFSIFESSTNKSVTPKEQCRDFFENTPICIEYTITGSEVGEDKTLTSSTFRRITVKELFDKFFQSITTTTNHYGP